MDELELTEENLKRVLVEKYAKAVALRQDCEKEFRTLNLKDIRVSIYDNETTVEFPCLQCDSVAGWCARNAAEETSKCFFGDKANENNDSYLFMSDVVPRERWRTTTSMALFSWRHHL